VRSQLRAEGTAAGFILFFVGPLVDYIGTGIRVDQYLAENYDLPLITGLFCTSLLGVRTLPCRQQRNGDDVLRDERRFGTTSLF
jgi:hypothetical protein